MDKQKLFKDLSEEETKLVDEIKELNIALDAIRVLLKRYHVDEPKERTNVLPNKVVEIIRPIKNTVTTGRARRKGTFFPKKVLEALELVGSGTASQVADTIKELYPEIGLDEARLIARTQLSKLNANGRVIREKLDGKSLFIYKYIKPEEVV